MKQRSPNSTLDIWQSPFKGRNPGLQTQIPPIQMAPPLHAVVWPLLEVPQRVPGIPTSGGEIKDNSVKLLGLKMESRRDGGSTGKVGEDFGIETNLGEGRLWQLCLKFN